MLTYQLQPRIFKLVKGTFQFPNKVAIQTKLAPPMAFGTKDDLSRTLVQSRQASVIYNANTGRMLGQSDPPLEALEVVVESPETRLQLKGDLLNYEAPCENITELEGIISAFQFVFLPLLNLEFADPPIIEYTKGWVGDVEFRWEHQECQAPFRVVTAEGLEKHVAKAYERFNLFTGTKNRRLAAALQYFHIASRLIVSGNSPWEFTAESILNMCKAIEILFVESESPRDDVRRELKKLDYTDDQIEGDFIPLFILRSHVDVAHPGVAIHKKSQLRTLYRFLSNSEDRLRELLKRVVARVEEGTYKIRQIDDLTLNPKDRKEMDKLIDQIQSRLVRKNKPTGDI